MSESMLSCPTCGFHAIVKNGQTRHGKQNYKCNDCGRQFVENPKWRKIKEETTALIDRLLLEKIPLAGIARAIKVSEAWLQNYVNAKYDTVTRQVIVQSKPKKRLTVQMDELWTFVDDSGNEQWVWLAIDVETREIVGCYIGDRKARISQSSLALAACGLSAMCSIL